jgi:anti-sigma B factor antagonist
MLKYEDNENLMSISILNEINIYNATKLKTLLDNLIYDKRCMEINLSEVSEIDSSGIQLLMFIKQERSKKNLHLSLVQHSNAVLDAFEFLGLVSYFNDPVLLTNRKGDSLGT